MMNYSETIRSYCAKTTEEFEKIAEMIAKELLKNDNIQLAVKWKRLTFALGGDFHHWICAIGFSKKSVNLTFHFGGLLDDPYGLFITGESRFLRKIEFTKTSELDPVRIRHYFDSAIDRLDYFRKNWKTISKA